MTTSLRTIYTRHGSGADIAMTHSRVSTGWFISIFLGEGRDGYHLPEYYTKAEASAIVKALANLPAAKLQALAA